MLPLMLLKFALFLKGLNWPRILLVSALAIAIFLMGSLWSDSKHAEHEADFEKAKAVAIAAREKELNDEWLIRLTVEEGAREMLTLDLSAIIENRDLLIEEIRSAQLTKPEDGVNIESCLEADDETVLVIANPFTARFTELYNDGSRGIERGDEEARPKTD